MHFMRLFFMHQTLSLPDRCCTRISGNRPRRLLPEIDKVFLVKMMMMIVMMMMILMVVMIVMVVMVMARKCLSSDGLIKSHCPLISFHIDLAIGEIKQDMSVNETPHIKG